MSAKREITVGPDHFEAAEDDALLLVELESAIAVCVYDAVEEAGAVLHLRCIVRAQQPIEATDSTLATELLLLDRCVETVRKLMPTARHLQARIVAHLADHPSAADRTDSVLTLVRQFLTDADVTVLPADIATGRPRSVRFRPSMGWVQVR